MTTGFASLFSEKDISANLGKWNVAKAKTLDNMFKKSKKFTGVGLEKWKTTSVTTLAGAFNGAVAMNANVAGTCVCVCVCVCVYVRVCTVCVGVWMWV